MTKSTLSILLAALTIPALAAAQTPDDQATVAGVVVAEESGDAIVGATIRIAGTDREVVSGPNGGFRFDVPRGEHTLEVTSLGRVVLRRTVSVGPDGVRGLSLALGPDAIRAPEIRVALDRFRLVPGQTHLEGIAGSAHYIGPEKLYERKQLYDDVHAVLRQVPGVNIQEEDGYGLRPNIGIRGTGSERSSKITLMEDGVLIAPAPYAAPSAYYFPVIGRMQAVEVRKGSSQIKYGPHTIGGAINLMSTPIPREFRYNVNLEGGQDRSGKLRLSAGNSYDHVGWMIEGYSLTTDGFKEIDGGGDEGFEITDFVGKFRVNTAPDAPLYQELELKLQRYDETSDETYLGLTDADFDVDPFRRYAASRQDVMNAEHSQVQLRWFVQPGEGAIDLTTVAYRNDFERNWFKLGHVNDVGIANILADPDTFAEEFAWIRGATSPEDAFRVRANNREYFSAGVQSVLGARLDGAAGRHEMEFGVRFHEDEEDRFQHEDRFRMVDGQMILTTSGEPGSQANRISDAEAWSFFVQDRIEAGRWTVTPGVRFESIDFTRTDFSTDDPDRTEPTRVRENSVSEWIPGVGLTYEASSRVHVFGGVHKGFGPPGPGADEATEPESSVNYELGARVRTSSLSAQATAFVTDYDNILGRETLATGDESGTGKVFNGGEVDVQGIELSLDYDPAAKAAMYRFPVTFAYTYTSAEFQSNFESDFDPWGTVRSGDELPYIANHQFHAGVGLGRGPWVGRIFATYVGEMRTEAGSGSIPAGSGTDSYTTLDLSAEYATARFGTVFAGVQNLTDEEYIVARRPAGARPGLSRTFLAGVRVAR